MQRFSREAVNNALYDHLGDDWYTAQNDPVALLRSEVELHGPVISRTLATRHGAAARVLEAGCGAGFLSNKLARDGFDVVGVDLSEPSLGVARDHDTTHTVRYLCADVRALPFPDASFDAVCAMDVLEHVEEPRLLVAEASRVLRPGGTFFFHTFNRNWLSWLIVIKGVEWVIPRTPRKLHVYHLFIKPEELRAICSAQRLPMRHLAGVGPEVWNAAFWRLLATGIVSPQFRFAFKRSRLLGYFGYAERLGAGATRSAEGRGK